MSFYQAMQEALESPRYAILRGDFDGVLDRALNLLDRLLEWLLDMFNVEFSGIGDGVDLSILSGIFMAVAIFIAAAAVIFFVQLYLKRRRKKGIYSDEIFEDFRNNRLSFDEIMGHAKKHDENGNLKEAVRYRYLGMIMLFSLKEIVDVKDSMTGSQFEREATKSMPSLRGGVQDTINMYYNLFFGHKSVSGDAYNVHLEVYDAVIKEAGSYEKS